MKKEVFIAIASGLILGLIITLGIFTANKSLEQQKAKKQAELQDKTTPSPPNSYTNKSLQVTSHQNFDLLNQSKVTISGVVWPEAIVALITENNQYLSQADLQGDFSFDINLVKGYNELTIVATDQTEESQTQELLLTYSTTEFELPEEENSKETTQK